MSLMTTHPEILESAPSISKTRLCGGYSHKHPAAGAGMDGNPRLERRRNGSPGDSPIDVLTRLPAVVLLERMPVPSLAMARDGVILFANTAFAEMIGYRQESLAGLALPHVSRTALETLYALSDVHAPPNMVVELQHHEGWTVRAKMSKSALMRCDDPVVLVTFENLTERLWMDER